MTDLPTLLGRPVCGHRGKVRLAGGVDDSLTRGVDICYLPPGHPGDHSYATEFPASRIGRYQEAGSAEEPDDA